MSYIDAHCHLTDPGLHVAGLLGPCEAAGITAFAQGGITPEEWQKQSLLARLYPGRILPVYGLHPWAVHQLSAPHVASALAQLEACLAENSSAAGAPLAPPVALGEIGLDRALRGAKVSWSRQVEAFRVQLELAARYQLPVVLHVVKAHGVALEILTEFAPRLFGGFAHAFAGDASVATQYVRLGFCLSLAPGSLLKLAPETIAKLPDAALLIESDAPDAAIAQALRRPGPKAKTTPLSLWDVALQVASIRQTSTEAVLGGSSQTLRRLFRLETTP